MARDERKTDKIRALEGINRSLTKRLKQVERDNARLRKMLDKTLESNANLLSDEVVDEVEVQDTKDSGKITCEKCKSNMVQLDLGNIGGKHKVYYHCSNSQCKHWKKA